MGSPRYFSSLSDRTQPPKCLPCRFCFNLTVFFVLHPGARGGDRVSQSGWARTPISLPAAQLWYMLIPIPEAATLIIRLVFRLPGQPNPLPQIRKGPTHKHLETCPIQLPLFQWPARKILDILAVPNWELGSQATMRCLDSRSGNCSQAESRGNHGVHFMNFKTTGLLPQT